MQGLQREQRKKHRDSLEGSVQTPKKSMGKIDEVREKLLDLLYPPGLYCSICGNLIDDAMPYHLCAHCMAHIRWDMRPPMEVRGLWLLCCTKYGMYERSLIFALKYQGKKYIARDIAEMMADKYASLGMVLDVIVPVPMYPEKERKRGFNQAALIGKYLAERTGIPMVADGLLRVRETTAMRGLSPEERAFNIRGSFVLNEKRSDDLQGKRILLLDDFATTGATGREARAALFPAHPEEVLLYSFAARYGDRILAGAECTNDEGLPAENDEKFGI